jgi:hypothetical protein
VGDGAAFLVQRGGLVRAIDPASLVPVGEAHLGVALGSGLVVERHLVVPGADGRLHVVGREGETGSAEVGEPGADVRVSLVGEEVVGVDLTAGRARMFDLDGEEGTLHGTGEQEFDAPGGEVVVAPRLPAGRLWLLALGAGELHGIDLATGESGSVTVAPPGGDIAGPVVARGRVYLIDRTAGRIVEVDAARFEVLRQEPLQVDDASQVEVLVQGETVFVNDRASARAVVINGDDHRTVDKYQGGEDPTGDDPPTPPNPTTTLPPDPGPDDPPPERDDAGDDDPGDRTGYPPPETPSTTPTTPTTTTTIPPPPTTTTTVPTTTTTTRPRTPPGAVAGLDATAGDARVTLSWGAASSTLPVSYTIAVSPAAPGGTSFTTAGTGYTFTGLTNDVTYRFTVTPSNADGAGPGAQTDATPEAPDLGPRITYTLVRPVITGSPNQVEVGFDYDSGSALSTTCTAERSGDPSSRLSGSCSGTGTEYIGSWFLDDGECASFVVTLSTAQGTDTATTETECAPSGSSSTTPGTGTVIPGVTCRENGAGELICS